MADSFSEFLEHDLADPDALGARVSRDLLGRARELAGPLASGEVYRLDRRLEPLGVLRVERQDALLFHKAIRDLADAQEAGILPPQRLNDILPPEYLEFLGAGLEGAKAPWGLYLNSHVGFNTLLSLRPEGSYVLLFWDSHAGDFGAFRFYQGNVRLIEGAEGGRIFNLDIPFDYNSLGSDGGFEQLHFVADPAGNWLLQDERLESLADDLNWDGRFRSDNVLFRSAGFDDLLPGHTESVAPPALLALPEKLRAMLRHEPLKARILSIDWDTLDPEYDTVQAVIDLGEEDGAKMNLPFALDQSIDKDYTGHINDPGPGQSGINLRLMTDAAGEYLYRPDVGDLLAGCKRSTP